MARLRRAGTETDKRRRDFRLPPPPNRLPEALPRRDVDWLPHLNTQSFLGRRWSERLFDAGQGAVFHDPDDQFGDLWRRFVRYPPPDIQRALLARSLFRAWNAGPEYNLTRAWQRGRFARVCAMSIPFRRRSGGGGVCAGTGATSRRSTWRLAHFDRLRDCPVAVREGVASLAIHPPTEGVLAVANTVLRGIKQLVSERFSAFRRSRRGGFRPTRTKSTRGSAAARSARRRLSTGSSPKLKRVISRQSSPNYGVRTHQRRRPPLRT